MAGIILGRGFAPGFFFIFLFPHLRVITRRLAYQNTRDLAPGSSFTFLFLHCGLIFILVYLSCVILREHFFLFRLHGLEK